MKPRAFLSPAGEAFVLVTCGQVDVRIEKNNTCFEDMPVYISGEEKGIHEAPIQEDRDVFSRN